MSIGLFVRKLFGSHEKAVANLYRSAFLDLHDFTEWLVKNTNPKTILEIGCGEGAVTENLSESFPDATIHGIDISPNIARLYEGRKENVFFSQIELDDFVAQNATLFDLVILSDVLHHVPGGSQKEFLKLIKPLIERQRQAVFVLKDWQKLKNPIHYIAYLSDRLITGDRITYRDRAELCDMIRSVFGENAIRKTAFIKPWKNNLVFLIAPQEVD